jgi:capsular polysaccharide export protein
MCRARMVERDPGIQLDYAMRNELDHRHFLLLQGPTNLLFARVAEKLRVLGHVVHRVNVCLGDELFWRGPGAVAYRGRREDWPAFVASFYAENAITDLVLLGEKRDHHREAIAAARSRGIAVTVTDFGYLRPDWIVVERDGMNGDSRFPREPAEILARAHGLPPIDRRVRFPHRALNQALWDMKFHLSSALFPFTFPHFKRHTLNHPIPNYLATGVRLTRGRIEARRAARTVAAVTERGSYYVFAMQMEDDYSLRGYSTYPDLDTAMREAIESFAAHAPGKSSLVFKVHPLDPGYKNWRSRIGRMAAAANVASRVHYIDGGNLDALIERCAGFVTINSTAGLRALELGRPTIALGQAVYRVPGLTFEGRLDDFWTRTCAPDATLVDATLRLMGAMLHVRGSFYDPAGIEAAATGITYRLHHGLVNTAIAGVLRGEIPRAA